jgi:hypothetical protein
VPPFPVCKDYERSRELAVAMGILAREGNLEGVISAVPTSLFGPSKGRVLTVGLLGLAATLLFAAPAKAERPGWYANPSLSGEARVGATLSVNQGGIKCDNCLGTALEWTACTGAGNAGADRPTGGLPFDGNPAPGCVVRVPFPGTPTYTPGPADAGLHIQAHIVADNRDCGERRQDGTQECANSRGHAYTQTIGPIAGAAAPAAPAAPTQPAAALPLFTAAPAITGSPVLGQTLTATPGTVTGTAPIAYSYQWFRCSTALRGCQPIQGSTGTTYTVERADLGARITVTVTASNRGGGRAATARLTTHVRAAAGAGAASPARPAGAVVKVADLAPAERLTVDNVAAPRTIRPGGSAVLRVRVANPRGVLVDGAAVEVFGRPGEIASAMARKTGANGVAVIRVRAAALAGAREIVLVVVASKPNDDSPAVKLVRLRVQA